MGPPVRDVTGFLWFSKFQVDFHGSRLVFHGFSWLFMVFTVPGWFFMVFHGSWLIFHGSSLVFMVFHGSRSVFTVPGRFFMVPGRFSWLQVGFHGFSWFQVGSSWFFS